MVGPTVGRAEVDVHADLSPFRRELATAAAIAGRNYADTLAQNLDRRLRRVSGSFDKFWLSTLKGSRNDFLNFVGVVSSGMEALVGRVIGTGLGFIANSFDRLGDVMGRISSGPFQAVSNGLGKVADGVRGLGAGGIDGLVIQLIGFSLAIQTVVGAAGVLAGGISTLSAAVTALAVGIGGALLGGIVALIPAMGALAVGVGALVVGFNNMTKEQKEFLGPLTNVFKEIRGAVQETLFQDLADQMDGLVRVLRPLGPFLASVAAVFGDWAADVIASIGPGSDLGQSLSDLGQTIPDTLRRVLDIVASLGGALIGLFDAATPAANRLLDSIGGVLQRFNEWVNSVEGQQAINTFLQTAIDLLGTLFGIASEVGRTLSTLWTQGGAEAAQVLLQSIRGIVAQFNAWLATEEGRDALLQWFRDGVTAIQDIGAVLAQAVALFDALDTSLTREGFSLFLLFLATLLAQIRVVVNVVQTVANTFDRMTGAMGRATEAGRTLLRTSANVADGVAGFFSDMAVAVGRARRSVIASFVSLRAGAQEMGNRLNAAFVSVILASARLHASVAGAFNRLRADINSAVIRAATAIVNFRVRASDAARDLAASIFISTARAIASFRNLAIRAGAAMAALASAIQRRVAQGVSLLTGFASRAVSALLLLPAHFAAIGVNMMQGLFNGIVSRGGQILDYLRNLAAQAAAAFSAALGISSPSKVFAQYGENIVEGLINGIRSGFQDVTDATNTLAGAAIAPTLNTPVSALAEQATTGDVTANRSTTDIGGITIVTPFANPRLVALEVMDSLAARGK